MVPPVLVFEVMFVVMLWSSPVEPMPSTLADAVAVLPQLELDSSVLESVSSADQGTADATSHTEISGVRPSSSLRTPPHRP